MKYFLHSRVHTIKVEVEFKTYSFQNSQRNVQKFHIINLLSKVSLKINFEKIFQRGCSEF